MNLLYYSLFFYTFSCALSSGSLACISDSGKLNIVSLTKTNKDILSVDINENQIKAVPGSPIPAFIITKNNVEKLVYIKDNQSYSRSLTTRASLFIYTYIADRHILLQVTSPTQVCIVKLITALYIKVILRTIYTNQKYIIFI